MCKICVDLMRQQLSSSQAMKNLNEMVQGRELLPDEQDHVEEVLIGIQRQELVEKASTL